MRGLLLTAFFLFALTASALPGASAQATGASTAAPPLDVLQDAAGDVSVPVANAMLPAGMLRSYDLRGLAIAEDEDSVTFTAAVAGLYAGVPDVPEGRGMLFVHFNHGAVEYRLRFEQNCEDGACYWSTLQRWSEPGQRYIWVEGSQPQEDSGAGLLSVSVAKASLADQASTAPFQGRVLDHLWVEAIYSPVYGEAVGSVDRMPDTGEAAYSIRGGLAQTGGVALWSEQPFRGSNGEATTYVYTVHVENQGPAGEFSFGTDLVPSNWQVQFPQPTVEVGSGQSLSVPVLATVPFAHEHGTRPSFLVHLQGTQDSSRQGQIRLGVLYSNPPMPAGHHSDLYFHTESWGNGATRTVYDRASLPGQSYAWMTTMEDDENDQAVAVPGYAYQAQGSSSVKYGWYPDLYDLDIGLDFDLAKPVALNVPIHTDVTLPAAQLQASLYVGWRMPDGGWGTVRLVTLTSDTLDLGAGETHLFQLEGLPTPDADRIGPHKDGFLEWNILLTGQRPAAQAAGLTPEAPALMPGGSVHLPLLEYHDPVDQVFAALDRVKLQTDGPSSKSVNPGETVLFNLTLQNDAQAGRFHIALRGEHAPWARIVGSDHMAVADGGLSHIVIAVTAPADAADGQPLDLLVEAHGPGGATALLRLSGQVVTGMDVPDEVALAGGMASGHNAPAPAAGLLLVALGALALARRR